ncbi:MAG: STAS domain-containing protein [Thermodesulfobacteriota bacterium]
MELRVIAGDDKITQVALSGKLDVAGEQKIGDQFRDLLDARKTSFIVEMSEVSYLASLGIRLLFAGAKSLAAHRRKLVVVNPQPMVQETLLSSGTAKVIPIVANVDEALKLLST